MLGGIAGGRPLYDLPFEQALNRVLGKRIIDDDSFASAVWSALSNVTWKHSSGMEVSYSFRAAGDLGVPAIVCDEIANALSVEGWTYKIE